jgi:glycosyltransferase involved in cell wall biosynthesis
MSKRLIVCSGALQHGGAERVLSVLSPYFASGFDYVEYVLWLDWRFPGCFYEIDDRVKIIGISEASGSRNVLKQMIWFRKHVKESNPTVILSFFEMVSLCVISSLIFANYKIVVSERNDPYFFQHGKFYRSLINLAYRLPSVKRIIMQTQHNKDYFKNTSLYDKTIVVYNPINFNGDMVGSAILHKKDNVIISAARLEPQKKQQILIKAFSVFVKTHPDYKLKLFGEGSCRENLESYVSALGIKDSVMLPGNTTHIWEEMKSSKMFVMSSEFEGMSNSLIEAMCLGVPCISTKVSGATDLIIHGENGYLVDQDDVEAIGHYMSMIADDDKLAYEIGKNSSKVFSKLAIEQIASVWTSVLLSV